jgi:CubicO group peptidase (beta-lactamase class C family)
MRRWTLSINPFYPILIGLFLLGQFFPKQTFTAWAPEAKKDFAALEAYIPAEMKKNNVPGLSVAIFHEHEIIYNRGFGVKNANTGEPVNEYTVFEAASFSKTLTAYGALKLVEKGRLSLDEPLNKYLKQKYLPEWSYAGQITLRMILTHTSGLSNDSDGDDRQVYFTPGDHFSYSGAGFRYLQQIIEDVTGLPFAEFMDQEIIHPLAMRSSSFVFTDKFVPLIANGHETETSIQTRPVSRMAANAAYSLLSNPTDMAKFNLEICHPTLLQPETVTEMLKPAAKWKEKVYWGLGIGLLQSRAGTFFWHWGNNYYYRNIMVTDQDTKTGVIIMTNSSTGLKLARRLVVKIINDYFLEKGKRLDTWTFDFLE